MPILMYHVLGDPPPSAPLPGLWVSKSAFAAQLRALADAGYQAVTLRTVLDAWDGRGALPRRPVVLTFDDGYLSQATIAAPLMAARHWPGTLDLALGDLGPDGLPRHLAKRMLAAGWEIASHTVHHVDLTTLGAGQLRDELVESRAMIRRVLGTDATDFCYPAGRYSPAVEAAVRAAGYRSATTEVTGFAHASGDRYALPRLRITNADSPSALLARLR